MGIDDELEGIYTREPGVVVDVLADAGTRLSGPCRYGHKEKLTSGRTPIFWPMR